MATPQFMPDIDVERLTIGRQTDKLVALYVMGWREWHPGEAVRDQMFVVNPTTYAIEYCQNTEWLLTPTTYPECAAIYRFSQDRADAMLAYTTVMPLSGQEGDLSPLEMCKEALRRKLDETPNENV